MRPLFSKITICGVGLVGGSLGLAIKRAFPKAHICGIDKRRDHLSLARRRKAIDEAGAELRNGVAHADLVILAMPVDGILAALREVGRHVKPGTVITDVGSTKTEICKAAARHLPPTLYFIGGHPIAGKAYSGFKAADANLFDRATYALCPQENVPDHIASAMIKLVRAIKARALIIDPACHDQMVAYTSHLPQLLSIGIADVLGSKSIDRLSRLMRSLSGGGLRDMTRLASSPFDVWKGICQTNRRNISKAIDEYIGALKEIRARLASEDLKKNFTRANAFHRRYK